MVLKTISLLFILFLFLFSSAVFAHPFDTGFMFIKADTEEKSIYTAIEIHPALVRTRNFFHETLGRSNWTAGNRKCKWRDSKAVSVNSETLKISARAECPGLSSRDRLSLDLRFLENSHPSVKIFIRAITPDYESTLVVNRSNHFIKMAPTLKAGFMEYTILGIEALGVSPSTWAEGSIFHIPFGLNQLLLVLLMIAISQSFGELFRFVGGFTLSLSLALSWVSLGGTGFEARYLDILVAFGLLYFSLDIILLKNGFRRILLSITLGLIHGLKMGELLLDFDLPSSLVPKALTGFLFGIVFAQLLVIMFMSPVFNAIKKYSYVQIPVHAALSLIAAIIGTLWLFEKTVVILT